MKPQHIDLIPINQIRIVNPRSRNKVTFRGIVNNIGSVGLKKPITVFQRTMEADGTQYDLVCGQGRMEAVAALGGTAVSAIITDASLSERYLMSLIENIARKRPRNSELLRVIQELMEAGCKNHMIAEKLGMDPDYVHGVIQLLQQGEKQLVSKVESGTIPLSVAVKIATATSDEVQRALSEAYEKGVLRGDKLRIVQRLIATRSAQHRGTPAENKAKIAVTGRDLAKEYERHTQRQRALVQRASLVNGRLTILRESLKQLFRDDAFVTLLRAEALDKIPQQLATPMVEGR
jgi:ParB family chromosome partitioning protein